LDLTITEGNKQKRARPFLALPLSSLHTPFHELGVWGPTQFSQIPVGGYTFWMDLWGKAWGLT
jgi:hypothetical protein